MSVVTDFLLRFMESPEHAEKANVDKIHRAQEGRKTYPPPHPRSPAPPLALVPAPPGTRCGPPAAPKGDP